MKKYINQQDMKQANISDVLFLIRDCGAVTRKQLESLTDLSWGAVSNITARLLEGHYVVEHKPEQNAGAGRIPALLELNGEDHFIIGVDVNHSGFHGTVINLKNEIILESETIPSFSDKEELLCQLTEFLDALLSKVENHHLLGVGLAMQGQVDAREGISVQLPNCKNWSDVPLAQMLEERYQLPFFLEHDPNCILYAHSVNEENDEAILLRVDDGIGMAVMLDGKILYRPGMFEIGHMCVKENGWECSCGRKGCLEAYASRKGLARQSEMSFERLAERALSGNAEAQKQFETAARYLAQSVANTAHLLNISEIVLCGSIWKYRELIFPHLCTHAKLLAPELNLNFRIIETTNASLGVALIAANRSIKKIEI